MNEYELSEHFSIILGKKILEARKILSDYYIRATIKDGISITVDSSYKPNRLNVELKNNKIIKILSIG